MEIHDGYLMVNVSGVALELATGAISPAPRWPLGDGITVEVAEDASSYLVHTPEGSVALEMNEMLIPYDDDLGSPVAVLQDQVGGLIATWRDDGSELWRRTATETACQPMARLRGALITQCWGTESEALLALDLLTGAELWSRTAMNYPIAATSASVILIDQEEGELIAVDAVTGTPHWSVPTSVNDLSGITELSNGIVVVDGRSITRLLWD